MKLQRRALIAGAAALAAARRAHAQTVEPRSPTTLPIWPDQPPGAPAGWQAAPDLVVAKVMARKISQPTITVYRPAQANGSAVIILPGGGYGMLSVVGEGSAPAALFNAAGITAFVLRYRLPLEGWAKPSDAPLQDAQRAMRLVRARAGEFGVDPAKIGVLGFSAGGHLASTLATRHAEEVYAAVDERDRQSARPAFAGLIYPVITMGGDLVEKGSRRSLLGREPSEALVLARSSERQVDAQTPPCFLVHGMDDKIVPVENSLMMLGALRAKKIPCEAHLFQQGAHGFGLGFKGQGNSVWPQLFVAWVQGLGWGA